MDDHIKLNRYGKVRDQTKVLSCFFLSQRHISCYLGQGGNVSAGSQTPKERLPLKAVTATPVIQRNAAKSSSFLNKPQRLSKEESPLA